MKKPNKSRRKFLKQAGKSSVLALSGPALDILLQGLVGGAIHKAQAANLNQDVKNFIQLIFPGGPPRWLYDLWLTPHEGDNARRIPNGSIVTRLSGSSSYNNAAYSLSKIGGLYLPWMWRFNIPSSQGSVKMSNLLSNMAVIRGIDMEINNHRVNQERQDVSVPGRESIGGRIADHTNFLINGMRIGHNLPFVSKKGATITNASIAAGKNSLDLTLRDFRSGRNVASKELNQNYRSALERAIGSINSHINADASYSKILGKDRVNAELLVRRGLADVDEFWQEAYPRYNSLIRSVLSERKSGGLHSIADKPIVANSGQPRWYEIADQKPSHGDFRNLIDNSTYIINMAESFAIIEYLMREELTGYVNAAMLPLYNLKRTSSAKFNSRHDLHSGGKVITTYAMTMYYRAYASCLNELIESLKNYSSKSKGGSLFDHTLISMTSEFNRSARDDGTGADHGFRAHSISLHGGMIKGPLVLGDIKRGETSGRYKGTWGEAAPTRLLNGESEVIKIGHIAETILTLLGIPGLSVNAFSLMTKDGKPLTKKARLV